MTRRRFAGLAALALVAGAASFLGARAWGQGEEGAGPPPKTPAAKECRRVLDQIAAILAATQKNDAKAAVKGLRDASWAVRQFTAVRLGTMGLDEATVRGLRAGARPGLPPPPEKDPAVVAAEKWANDWKPPEEGAPAEAPSVGDEGIRIYVSMLKNELAIRKADPKELARIVGELPTWAEAAGDKRALGFVAREIIAAGDEELVLRDLGAKDVKAAVADDGKKVLDWCRKNAPYFYYHPADRGVRVDLEARSAGTPTEKFREKTPWKAGEGPQSPANPKKREQER